MEYSLLFSGAAHQRIAISAFAFTSYMHGVCGIEINLSVYVLLDEKISADEKSMGMAMLLLLPFHSSKKLMFSLYDDRKSENKIQINTIRLRVNEQRSLETMRAKSDREARILNGN